MRKKDIRTLIITVFVCLAPMILGAVLYSKLPQQMAIHFTIGDKPDNYASKNFVLFGLPLIMAAVQAFVMTLSGIKINTLENEPPKLFKIMFWFMPIITVMIYIITVEYSLGSSVYIGKSVCLILGILFIIIGNYVPKMNYSSGRQFIHPAPKDEKTFRLYTRIMGYGFIIVGIILLVLVFIV